MSWMIVEENGEHKPVDLRTRTRTGVLAAVRRAQKAGRNVVSAYQGGPHAIALSPQVYPKRPA
jgi:hypothetical protein